MAQAVLITLIVSPFLAFVALEIRYTIRKSRIDRDQRRRGFTVDPVRGPVAKRDQIFDV